MDDGIKPKNRNPYDIMNAATVPIIAAVQRDTFVSIMYDMQMKMKNAHNVIDGSNNPVIAEFENDDANIIWNARHKPRTIMEITLLMTDFVLFHAIMSAMIPMNAIRGTHQNDVNLNNAMPSVKMNNARTIYSISLFRFMKIRNP